ncbi:MAG: hypothetical protein IPM54_37795 [Polyangiaceae bacterium]|nr:hypothetical protein [Polyangiaceae bacterium]
MKRCAFTASIGILLFSVTAHGQTYRLRADAYVSSPPTTTGLVFLHGEARKPSYFDSEAAVWMGSGETPADVLVMTVRARDPMGRAELRVGRMMASMGAIRPLHIDGADAIVRAPWGSSIEFFGGLPVTFGLAPRNYSWVVGGRAAQRIGQRATVGFSYLHSRLEGKAAFEEIGIDGAASFGRVFDGAFTTSLDLLRIGVSDARISIATRFDPFRIELFAVRRSPSRLLPATSLFAALGDVPSDRAGGSIHWRAAPRLDVRGEGAFESLGGALGGQFFLRSTLRLDDRGDGALGLELRRQGAPTAAWTGIRGTARLPLAPKLSASTELELVWPDDPRDRGTVWPWGIVALRYAPASAWDVSGAVEANASPTNSAAIRALVRLGYSWGGP